MRRATRFGPALAALLLAACADYPRDISGTLDEIHVRGTLRVGFAAIQPEEKEIARAFVARLERATEARAVATTAPAEHLLAQLEDGNLDLVMGDFAADTPWLSDVAVIEPLSERREGQRTIGLAPVAANGENRWIVLLEREVRNVRDGAKR